MLADTVAAMFGGGSDPAQVLDLLLAFPSLPSHITYHQLEQVWGLDWKVGARGLIKLSEPRIAVVTLRLGVRSEGELVPIDEADMLHYLEMGTDLILWFEPTDLLRAEWVRQEC